MSKLWGGRFKKETNKLVEELTASISFDQKLAKEDIQGSLAHVQMLGESGIISTEDMEKIIAGLNKVSEKLEKGELEYNVSNEDIHMNIEAFLIEEIGPVGGKLHTGRSRNDQVATDMHLYLKNHTQNIIEMIESVQAAIVSQSEDHIYTLIPGYTHLQRAQPVSFAHHLMAYFWMLQRDKERYIDSLERLNWLPLGAGALAGTTFPINRERVAELLGFDNIYPNSMDAVSNRDFIVEFLSASSMLMMPTAAL